MKDAVISDIYVHTTPSAPKSSPNLTCGWQAVDDYVCIPHGFLEVGDYVEGAERSVCDVDANAIPAPNHQQ